MTEPDSPARGFEQGPIRPPSEAFSLLLRVTRNCPWNRCRFCPVYKTEKFSRRETGEVIADIDAMFSWDEELKARSRKLGYGEDLTQPALQSVFQDDPQNPDLYSLILFQLGGGKTVFLQDADSLIIQTDELVKILCRLREKFPQVNRVTSYARTRTVAKKTLEDLIKIREAGLDRIHFGMESGSDAVLSAVIKGATQQEQIEAGTKARQAGFEISEYLMPGLGGKKFSREHALESAKVLNRINPDFIRLRSLAIPPRAPLYPAWKSGEFEPLNDLEMVREIKLLIENLEGITSYFVSDHILNLLPELEGKFPQDQPKLLAACDKFLSLSPKEQLIFIIGRRTGNFEELADLDNPVARPRVQAIIERLGLQSPEQADQIIQKIVENFI